MENYLNKGKFWTARYAVINATYFMGFCGVHAYASIYMLARGFTNSQIGMLIAFANIFSVIIQPVIAGFIDKSGKLTNRKAASLCTAAVLLLSLALSFVRREKIAMFIIFMLIYMIQMAYQPIIIAMHFEYAEKGCRINFGLARGIGSIVEGKAKFEKWGNFEDIEIMYDWSGKTGDFTPDLNDASYMEALKGAMQNRVDAVEGFATKKEGYDKLPDEALDALKKLVSEC